MPAQLRCLTRIEKTGSFCKKPHLIMCASVKILQSPSSITANGRPWLIGDVNLWTSQSQALIYVFLAASRTHAAHAQWRYVTAEIYANSSKNSHKLLWITNSTAICCNFAHMVYREHVFYLKHSVDLIFHSLHKKCRLYEDAHQR